LRPFDRFARVSLSPGFAPIAREDRIMNVRTYRTGLRCEHLENRDCPAIFVHGGVLAVIGTSGADTVDITNDGAGNVTATLNGTTREASGIRAVAVYTGGGNDAVTLDAGDLTRRFAFAVFGGGGDDTLSATVGGVAAGAAATVVLDGGAGNDTISTSAAGEIDGYLAVALTGGFGTDTILGEIDVAAGSTGRVAAAVAGGVGDDDLTLNVTGDGLDELASLRARLHGGPGTDTGVATDNVKQVSIEA
jgi:hypothetical protein